MNDRLWLSRTLPRAQEVAGDQCERTRRNPTRAFCEERDLLERNEEDFGEGTKRPTKVIRLV